MTVYHHQPLCSQSVQQWPRNRFEILLSNRLKEFSAHLPLLSPAWEGGDELVIGLRQGLAFSIRRTIPKNDNDIQVAHIIVRTGYPLRRKPSQGLGCRRDPGKLHHCASEHVDYPATAIHHPALRNASETVGSNLAFSRSAVALSNGPSTTTHQPARSFG